MASYGDAAAHPPPYGFVAGQAEANVESFKSVNAMINQSYNDDFVHLTLRVPGLKVKRQFNLSKTPKNARLIQMEYKKNFVTIKLAVNEGKAEEVIYKYTNSEPFLGPIEEHKSHIKFEDNIVHWYVKKAHKW